MSVADYGSVAGRSLERLKASGRVLGALLLREAEVRRGKGIAFGFLAAAAEPLLIIAAISILFTAIGRGASYGTSLFLFVGTGVFPVYLFIHTSMRIREPFALGLLGRLPVEETLDHVFVHSALHLFGSLLVCVGYFAFLYFVLGTKSAAPWDIMGAISALGAIFIFGVAMGIFNSVVARLIPIWDTLWPGIARAAVHFSGMYFIADFLSPGIRKWFALNPILHGVNWFRTAFYPTFPAQINNHNYLLFSSLVAITLGLTLEYLYHRRLAGADE